MHTRSGSSVGHREAVISSIKKDDNMAARSRAQYNAKIPKLPPGPLPRLLFSKKIFFFSKNLFQCVFNSIS